MAPAGRELQLARGTSLENFVPAFSGGRLHLRVRTDALGGPHASRRRQVVASTLATLKRLEEVRARVRNVLVEPASPRVLIEARSRATKLDLRARIECVIRSGRATLHLRPSSSALPNPSNPASRYPVRARFLSFIRMRSLSIKIPHEGQCQAGVLGDVLTRYFECFDPKVGR
jgi:hypothetical protein